jgi:hypothetical protein
MARPRLSAEHVGRPRRPGGENVTEAGQGAYRGRNGGGRQAHECEPDCLNEGANQGDLCAADPVWKVSDRAGTSGAVWELDAAFQLLRRNSGSAEGLFVGKSLLSNARRFFVFPGP